MEIIERLKDVSTINILGTYYKLQIASKNEEYYKERNIGGYCSDSEKVISILNLDTDNDWKDESETSKEKSFKHHLKHEIIHAYLNESGLLNNTFVPRNGWASNEEMVDWFAIQSEKIFKTFLDLEIIN